MSQLEPIHQVSDQLELTSRTLRHWEEKGLFHSERDPQSGWRMYSQETLQKVRLIKLLRELDIPLKFVSEIINSTDPRTAIKIVINQIKKLNEEDMIITQRKDLLNRYLLALSSMEPVDDVSKYIVDMEKMLTYQIISKSNMREQWEVVIMGNNEINSGALRIVALPAMRLAVYNSVSMSPEEEALKKVLTWAENQNLMGTARIFGFNTTKYNPENKEYGWAASITIPEQVILPEYLEEKRIPRGLYASVNSTNEVYDSWQTLMKLLKNNDYEVDESRTCLEEHIRSGEDRNNGYDFYLNLLQPIKK